MRTTFIEIFIRRQKYVFSHSRSADVVLDSKGMDELVFHHLINGGTTKINKQALDIYCTPPYLCNYLVAVLAPSERYDFWEFLPHSIDFPAIKVEIDRICQKSHNEELGRFLELALMEGPFSREKKICFFQASFPDFVLLWGCPQSDAIRRSQEIYKS
ncbi:hypothetical protein [Endozoicomonas sp. SCSIO W0465]|uniref:hypothetical protein n=1 Tax=Endozoicomonas sp. SCSIO W0465 TaxID=2918516 RepID=UPI002075E772|nr:hypothetical protein [Endozoicomonas sp. SCSIO W0465]USE35555.1 hypothetical protein MJO57_26270 [Endozoicomonas sp. SCSIO W0465]